MNVDTEKYFGLWTNFISAPGAKHVLCSILLLCIASQQRKAGVPAPHDVQLHIHSALSLGQ